MKGVPWEEGSRLEVETRSPFPSKVDQVVQHFSANESVGYLSHVFGITTETHVMFVRISAMETLMRIRMQSLGNLTRALGFAIAPTTLKAAKQFFRDFRWECEPAARKARGQS